VRKLTNARENWRAALNGRRTLVLLAVSAGLLAAPPVLVQGAGRAGAAVVAADAAAHPSQLITVRAGAGTSTYATLSAYRVSGRRRVLEFGPWQARVGYNGVARPGSKREGDGRTPGGSFGFSFFFGVQRNAGFAFPFRRAYRTDVWDDDLASPRYNEWVNVSRHNPGAAPEPMHQVPAYDYAAVIAYNTGRVPGRGSAIFLHVGTGSATAGCVSLPRTQLIRILRWLRPGDHPVITISAG